MEGALLAWWLALCAAATVNIALWAWSARLLARRAASIPPELLASRRRLLWLSAVYALGCAFRSVFPMVDLPRICLHDTWISRIVVGRTIATIAELCFALQWATLLGEAGPGGRAAAFVARSLVPVIALAELSCWTAVLTSNYLFHAVENSLWTIAAALALAAFLSWRGRVDADAARFLRAASACAVVYIAFMVTVDVPMYVERWLAASGSPSLEQGLRTLLARCVVERDWQAWRRDALWLSPYFSVVVWTSIMLAHAPRLRVLR
ncbi:MAG TPA: hypothetical protein VEH03_06620 [Burkholderiales bacterium]|nr:hypothetical protein [Burkholderiales bacterium]